MDVRDVWQWLQTEGESPVLGGERNGCRRYTSKDARKQGLQRALGRAGQRMEGKGTEVAKTDVPEAGARVAGAQTGVDEEKWGLMRFSWGLI